MSPAELLWTWLSPFPYSYCWDHSCRTSFKNSSALYCVCCDIWELVAQWTSVAQLVALPSPFAVLKPTPGCPLPSPTTHSIISVALMQGTSLHFLPLWSMVSHREFISAGIWALKPPEDWDYHKRCIPLDECMIQSLELEDGKRNASSGM